MQQCFMFIDTGNGSGWTPVNDSTKDIAALDSFVIDWGSDGIDEQPEPAVMSFTLRDRTGRLAGQALTLAGMKVIVQFSDQPDGKIFSRRWAAGAICASPSTRSIRLIRQTRQTRQTRHPKQCSAAPSPPAAASNRPATADAAQTLRHPCGSACNPKDRQTWPRNGTARTG